MRLERMAELNEKILGIERSLFDLQLDNRLRSKTAELDQRIRVLQLEIKLDELKLELKVEREKRNRVPSETLLYREPCYEN
jgi:hypothetical protein